MSYPSNYAWERFNMTERDLTDLDGIFHLADLAVTDPNLRMQYESIVHRLRKESEGVPMNTIQLLLLERIASNYIMLRQREVSRFVNVTPQQQKELNTFWLAMTSQFQKTLQKASAAEDREAAFREIGQSINRVLKNIEDPETRTMVAEALAAEFKAAGF